jgi:hypothetical protein
MNTGCGFNGSYTNGCLDWADRFYSDDASSCKNFTEVETVSIPASDLAEVKVLTDERDRYKKMNEARQVAMKSMRAEVAELQTKLDVAEAKLIGEWQSGYDAHKNGCDMAEVAELKKDREILDWWDKAIKANFGGDEEFYLKDVIDGKLVIEVNGEDIIVDNVREAISRAIKEEGA